MNSDTGELAGFTIRALVVAAVVVAAVIVLYFLWHIAQFLLVVFAGIMLGVLLSAMADGCSRRLRLPRPLSLALIIVVLLALLGGAGWIIGPSLVEQFSRLADRIPKALDSVQAALAASPLGRERLSNLPTWRDILPVGSELVNRLAGIFSTALGAVSAVVLSVLIGIYLAACPQRYVNNLVRLVPRSRRHRFSQLLGSLGLALRWWLVGRFSAMAVVGILMALGLWIVGVPLALTLGLIAAIFSFVPFIGPLAASIPIVLVALTESPILALWAFLVYAVVQLLESYVITPFIQQQAVFIPPALLISIQVLMGVVFGILGILLATPLGLMAIITVQILYVEDVLHDNVRIMGDHTGHSP